MSAAYRAACARATDAAGTERRGWRARYVKALRAEGLRILPVRKSPEPPEPHHIMAPPPDPRPRGWEDFWIIEG